MSLDRRIARNAVINLGGQVVPIAAGLVAIPWLNSGLGTDRFSLLLLAWAIVGYFGFVDLGLGRALTHAIASRLGRDEEGELEGMVWTGLSLLVALGVVGGVVFAAAGGWIAGHLKDVPADLRAEAVRSIYWLAASLPLVIVTAGLRGVIEAYGHFGTSAALRVPIAVFSYAAPLAVLPFTQRLDAVIAVLVAGRAIAAAAHFIVCVKRYWFLQRGFRFAWLSISPLLRMGGWMTVSNVVSPLMTYVDRFLISALLPVAAVAYYGTPYEAVTKLLIFPTAVVAVLFPEFAAVGPGDRTRATRMLHDGMRVIALCLFPVAFVLAALPHEILGFWLRDAVVAREGAPVLRWLAIGVFANSVAYVPFVALQGLGRADITGKANLAELPLYAALLWVFARSSGIVGVAVAWTIRVVVDAAVLVFFARRSVADDDAASFAAIAPMALAFAACFLPLGQSLRLGLAVLVVMGYVPIAWRLLLRPHEREAVLGLLT